MIDREKVIKGLDVCLKNIDLPDCPNDCPYLSDCLKYEKGSEVGMTNEDAIKWLSNLKQDIGQLRHEDLWPYAQAIDEIIEHIEDLEEKYTSLLNEKISELIEENAKLNLEMNQAISEQSIHTVDRR